MDDEPGVEEPVQSESFAPFNAASRVDVREQMRFIVGVVLQEEHHIHLFHRQGDEPLHGINRAGFFRTWFCLIRTPSFFI
jgi:hypothetical protein